MANSEPFQEHQRWFDVVHLHFTKVEKVKILRKEEKGKILLFHMKVDRKWIHGSNQPARTQRSRCRGPFSSDDNQFNFSASRPIRFWYNPAVKWCIREISRWSAVIAANAKPNPRQASIAIGLWIAIYHDKLGMKSFSRGKCRRR